MSDIVERLRDDAVGVERIGLVVAPPLNRFDLNEEKVVVNSRAVADDLRAAADEIERLRAALEDLVAACAPVLDNCGGYDKSTYRHCILMASNTAAWTRQGLLDVEEAARAAYNAARRALDGEDTEGTKAPNRAESTLSVPSDGEVERLESRVDHDVFDDLFAATERDAAATRCATCGAPYQVVRPGKIQPTCECDYHA